MNCSFYGYFIILFIKSINNNANENKKDSERLNNIHKKTFLYEKYSKKLILNMEYCVISAFS